MKIWVNKQGTRAFKTKSSALKQLKLRREEIRQYYKNQNRNIHITEIKIDDSCIIFHAGCLSNWYRIVEVKN